MGVDGCGWVWMGGWLGMVFWRDNVWVLYYRSRSADQSIISYRRDKVWVWV